MRINLRLAILFSFFLVVFVLAALGVFQNLSLALMLATQEGQRFFHTEIASKLRLIKETHAAAATMGLVLIGFAYGALHAVGPGHGKVVVSSYLLASKSSLRRGLMITFLASIMQACVAILVVFGLTSLFGFTHGAAQEAAVSLEEISFGLIMLVGVVLCFRAGRALWQGKGPAPASAAACPSHGEAGCSCGCCCGHAPDPREIEKADGWASLAVLVFSIGLRPCSGALLLLLFADLIGAYRAGVLATFAMAIGTAITTGLLAVLTVQFKSFALRFSHLSGDRLRLVYAGLGLAGGVLIFVFGGALLLGALNGSGFATLNDGAMATQNHPLMKGLAGPR